MQIVIDIDKDYYEIIKHNVSIMHHDFKPYKLIANGTPIPEHHGRIIDESKIEHIYYHIETDENEKFRIEHTVIDGTDAPTIIEGE